MQTTDIEQICEEILENFRYDNPSESVYKIVGPKGSGKSKILKEIEKNIPESGWIVLNVNTSGDILTQIFEMLAMETDAKESCDAFFDIGVELEGMIQKKILVVIDGIQNTNETVQFVSEYGRWLRAGYPICLVCTGLPEDMQALEDVREITFFRRGKTIRI